MIADPILTQAMRQWGLRDIPFCDSASHTPFSTPAWETALRQLNHTAALRSFMLLRGENGVGKSALAAHWLEGLEPKAYLPLAITQASLSATGLMAVLLHKLGQPSSLHRSRNLASLEKALHDLGRITPVLVMDDSQNYPPGALEEIRLLLGLNLSRQPAFALVLIGDSYLQDTLRLAHHRALYSRIAACCNLPPLERAQIEPYLTHGFAQAGLERPCLAPVAIELLAGASNGVPRQLNLLARTAWLEATQAGSSTIGAEHVRKAFELVPAAGDRVNP
jgi:type II secretory pathway predicted ATPase ExeA